MDEMDEELLKRYPGISIPAPYVPVVVDGRQCWRVDWDAYNAAWMSLINALRMAEEAANVVKTGVPHL